jgi:hypothetical protein
MPPPGIAVDPLARTSPENGRSASTGRVTTLITPPMLPEP